MKIIVSGKYSNDVFEDAFACQTRLKQLISLGAIEDVETNLEGIVYFPTVLSGELQKKARSTRSFSKKENALFAQVSFPLDEWVSWDGPERLQAMLDGLIRVIEGTDASKIDDPAKEEIKRRLSGLI